MQTANHPFRLEIALKEDGTLTLDDLPFHAGDRVEVIVVPQPDDKPDKVAYPLRGLPVKYDRPFDSVAADDWDAAL